MNGRVELLSPAGNFDAFLGALNAGADAVYLGGEKFGARAYADNFTAAEICQAVHIAHFMGRKVYLTVNTLFKEKEVAGLYDYLSPFYEAGLDGVIVQDLGVFSLIREWFPGFALHVSTQMTVTGAGAASLLKEEGAVRIVPARELSLSEIRTIKEETGLEIECFIHGAMCYCYSGQCLFSSILGGRSGNRGRCAQPCRLPYRILADHEQVFKEGYPLSLKDMCTLEYVPQLIQAGIDSFKIEGRMKKPEYAAGVTAMYRKYIDLYYRWGADGYSVEPEDMDRLRKLYIRSEIQTGYYERHNGKEMITLSKPGYMGSDEQVIEKIREEYLHETDKMPIRLSVKMKIDAPMRVCVEEADTKEAEPVWIEVTGEVVQEARKAPLTEDDVRKQMMKTGNSCVTVADCEIYLEGNVFVPVRALNQLRRDAIEAYEREVIRRNGLCDRRLLKGIEEKIDIRDDTKPTGKEEISRDIDCLVTTYEQFMVVMKHGCERLYIEGDLFLSDYERIVEQIKTAESGYASESCRQKVEDGTVGAYYLALPHILRKKDEEYLQHLTRMLRQTDGLITGFLCRNLEGIAYLRNLIGEYAVVFDAGMYCFHKEALKFFKRYGSEITIPHELNGGEMTHLVVAARELGMRTSLVAYGRIPMMITANCLRKTSGICPPSKGDNRQMYLEDRYQTNFPVAVNCEHCYNIIYNSVPNSVHTSLKEAGRVGADVWRYEFVTETFAECQQILAGRFPYEGYTTGHLKRGIE